MSGHKGLRNARVPPMVMRQGIRQVGRRVLNPDLPWETQRQRLDWVMRGTPVPRGTVAARSVMNGMNTEVVTAGGARPERTVVHFHGGGYCAGSARMVRAWAAHLSVLTAADSALSQAAWFVRTVTEHACP